MENKIEACLVCISRVKIYPTKWYQLLIKDKCAITELPIKGIELFKDRKCRMFILKQMNNNETKKTT